MLSASSIRLALPSSGPRQLVCLHCVLHAAHPRRFPTRNYPDLHHFPPGDHVVIIQSLSCIQLFATPVDCIARQGFSVHGISQAGILEWFAISFSRESFQPRDWTWVSHVSCISRQILYHWVTREGLIWDHNASKWCTRSLKGWLKGGLLDHTPRVSNSVDLVKSLWTAFPMRPRCSPAHPTRTSALGWASAL